MSHGSSRAPAGPGPALALRFALRGLRGGLSGFGILIACLALGVAAIVTVATLSRALTGSLAREGRVILGGDIAFSLVQRQATPQEQAWLAAQGRLGHLALLRAMARTPKAAALVEIKAVDDTWPLAGKAEVTGRDGKPSDAPLATLLAPQAGAAGGAVADPLLAARLGLAVGDRFRLGDADLVLTGLLADEPDKLASGFALGPRVVIGQAALDATRLIQPGSLVRHVYRLRLPPGHDGDAALARLDAEAGRRFPQAGWQVRSRADAAPQLSRSLKRFTEFLTLVGLTTLLVGGVGIASAARGHVSRQRRSIAALKSLGAGGRFVFTVSLIEVMALAGLGVLAGLAAGAALPFLAARLAAGLLPFPLQVGLDPAALGLGILYGLLTAFAFAAWPLGRAHDVPVSTLFRDVPGEERGRPRAVYMMMVAAGALALAAAAFAFAADRRIAGIYLVVACGAWIGLRLTAAGIMALAARLPRPRAMGARLALAALHRPGAATPSVVLSLGLGLTLLVALAGIEGSIRAELTRGLPARAPSFFFLDIPREQAPAFARFTQERAPGGTLEQVPMMRGRIIALNGVPVEKAHPGEDAAWVLQGDRGITYADSLPAGSRLVAGHWWPADYAGEPLVSFGDELARGLGLKLGDTVTVNVFGREITARIASLRRIDWQSMGINFVMVFSPATFRGAPHTELATLTLPPGAGTAAEAALVQAIATRFPAISTVPVRETLEAIDKLVSQLSLALGGASGVALLASVLVLAGALAAGQARRLHDAVILKTLGGTRLRLLGAFLLEYGVLGLVTAAFGGIAGSLAAYSIVTGVMHLPFAVSLPGVALALVFALFVTLALGLAQTFRILGKEPAPYLRNL